MGSKPCRITHKQVLMFIFSISFAQNADITRFTRTKCGENPFFRLKMCFLGIFQSPPGMPVVIAAMARSIFGRFSGSGLPSPKIQ